MTYRIDPFIDFLPQLDVHGYTEDIVMTVVNDFIYENYRLGKEKVVIIHGKGGGILKNKIHTDLKKNKYVKNFKLYFNNLGVTIVELKERD
jgi:DNA mismatch repair protein MutS2